MTAHPALVPLPRSVAVIEGDPFRLTAQTPVIADPDAAAAARRILSTATAQTLALPAEASPSSPALTLSHTSDIAPPGAYRLVAADTGVEISAAGAEGLAAGLHTLAQLLTPTSEGWRVPAVRIDDAPRFAYRGLMLDVARHFFPVADVRAIIDRAASLKLTHLHLHLTDDQGWRLQLRAHPALTDAASGSAIGGGPGGFYTQEDYRDIVAYAAARHITVVPEIDLPGHTHAVGLAYPHLAADPVVTPELVAEAAGRGEALPAAGAPYTGLGVGFSSLRLDEEATFDFVADVLGELAHLTPGPYLHLGGDEAFGTAADEYDAFLSRVTQLVADLGKVPVTWHDAGRADVAPETVGQYWGLTTPDAAGADAALAFVRRASGVILSPADAVYLDMKYDDDTPRGLTWAGGPTSVRRAYEWDPVSVIDGIADDDIVGVEAAVWTETIDDLAGLDAMMFPRLAAAAEAAWSAPLGSTPERSWESFRRRVGGLGPLWRRQEIVFHPDRQIAWTGE
ncbi:family 20 glycosylhydrolase [Microbacterium sp. ET2]|uniref:family 20 glycosylhydrolase n=1 Tax=Microbacterium albipurpureum TaxID=3050384 RepID=UPI00259C7B66|nr:family 20 glycosylhydrolase [Microbacterium sp. ET2 (Ac-2212)]WJL95012.1 family 20 glycosylhydrolase [Microbacterium sp. ET2 (Ac-2212)]